MRFSFRFTVLNYFIVLLAFLSAAPVSAQEFPGGFTEQPNSAATRQSLSTSQIQSMLPERGKFTFPQPYSTEGVRLTNAGDCNGSDCVNYIGYSYWRNINNHVGQDTMLILVSMDRSQGGAGPSLITYNKATDEVINLGPLFEESDARSWAHSEGWYFSANLPYAIYNTSHTKLQRYDVVSKQTQTVFDVTQLMGNGYYIWQVHSSNDDRVHSATVRDNSSYAMLGCMVYFEDTGQHEYFPRQGDFDECQVDKSGNWLLIKENIDNKDGEDNRIINLQTGQERILLDSDGAAGHSDMGYGYMIAADNWAANANTQKLWDFTADVLNGRAIYHNNDWNISAPAHVSHANSRADIAPEDQYACGSSVNRRTSAHANEIICFTLDGSSTTLVVAPVMTSLDATGGGDDYAQAPKGNLDPTGQYFIWTSNMGGSRLDAFLVKVPSHLISDATGEDEDTPPTDPTEPTDPTPPTPDPVPTPEEGTAAAVVWSNPFNAVANGDTLTKNAGCDGCADAGATSQREISTGDGYLEFTVNESTKLRYVGLSVEQSGTGAYQIDFALSIQGGYAEVRENGAYKSDTSLSTGDILRIAVEDGAVSYSNNGQVFYSSSVAPAYPLRTYASLFSMGSTVSNARFATAESGESSVTPPSPATPPSTGAMGPPSAISWTELVKAKVQGQKLIKKRSGCDGCPDASAISSRKISAGNAYLEFTIDETSKLRYVGLSEVQQGTSAYQTDFALAIQGGYAEVRENGTYRADNRISVGDVLRISLQEGKISYSRNGTEFYTSKTAPVYPLKAYANLLSKRSSVSNAVIAVSE